MQPDTISMPDADEDEDEVMRQHLALAKAHEHLFNQG